MDSTKLGPQTLEEAQASVRELIARLDAEIQSETERFKLEYDQMMSYRVMSFEEQEWQSHRLRQLARSFEERLYPVRQERERMINAIVRVIDARPPTFYLELTPAR